MKCEWCEFTDDEEHTGELRECGHVVCDDCWEAEVDRCPICVHEKSCNDNPYQGN